MHLTQVDPKRSMVAEWRTTRKLCNSSRPGSRPKQAVASTSFNCGGRRDFGVHIADVARRRQFVPPCSSVSCNKPQTAAQRPTHIITLPVQTALFILLVWKGVGFQRLAGARPPSGVQEGLLPRIPPTSPIYTIQKPSFKVNITVLGSRAPLTHPKVLPAALLYVVLIEDHWG